MSSLNKISMILFVAIALFSCNNDPVNNDKSIFNSSPPDRDAFDKWLYENYTKTYNVSFKYKMEDIESDHDYDLVPAKVENSILLAQIIKIVWFEAYDEVAGYNFTKTYVPRIIHLIGSGAYDSRGSVKLGTAEGGLKVTLYRINNLKTNRINPDELNSDYFHTMHHEFGHILHQTQPYGQNFKSISESNYLGGDWIYVSDRQARQLGFISNYSMSAPDEDFVELYAYYITHSEEWWNNMLKEAGTDGTSNINKKMEYVREYFNNVWHINIDKMRDVLLRKSNEVVNTHFLTFTDN